MFLGAALCLSEQHPQTVQSVDRALHLCGSMPPLSSAIESLYNGTARTLPATRRYTHRLGLVPAVSGPIFPLSFTVVAATQLLLRVRNTVVAKDVQHWAYSHDCNSEDS
eukprot:scaffold47202_cov22-Tisochrysis_lutea.AAC.1